MYHTFCLYNHMRTISTQETAGRCSCRVWKRESWSGIPAPFSREIQHPELLLSFSRISFSFPNRFRFQILANPARLPGGSQIPYPVNVFSNLALYFNQITDAGNLSFSDRPIMHLEVPYGLSSFQTLNPISFRCSSKICGLILSSGRGK